MNKRLLLIFLCFLAYRASSQHRVHYIANEGILIESGDKKILIDALFDNYYEDYLYPSAELVREMNDQKAPYNGINLFLSTHAHRDHFYSKMIREFMDAHPETSFISTTQAVDSLAALGSFDPIKSRVTGYPRVMKWQKFERDGLIIRSAFVRHGGRQNYKVDNLIFVIEVNGKRLIHLGDAEMDPAHFSALNLDQETFDVALVPYWYLAYPPGQEIVNKYMKADKIIGIHYPKVGDPRSLALIKEKFANAAIFMQTGEHSIF